MVSKPPKPRSSTAPLEIAHEEAIARLLVPPSPLQQLIEWRGKAVARRSLPPTPPPKPKKR
jgi:hypothetical protein